jgi:hypothetical protein
MGIFLVLIFIGAIILGVIGNLVFHKDNPYNYDPYSSWEPGKKEDSLYDHPEYW